MAKKIMLYEGLIRRLYAEGVHLVENKVVPMVKKEIAYDDALYYRSRGHYINMEYDVLLPSEEEATDYLNHVVDNRSDMIINYLSNPEYSFEEKKALFNMLASDSACLYFNPEDVHPSREITSSEFHELKKVKRKERKAKKGN